MILGEIIERYLFVSLQIYGWSWVVEPLPLFFLMIAAYVVVRPLVGARADRRKPARPSTFRTARPVAVASAAFSALLIIIIGGGLYIAAGWSEAGRTGPFIIGTASIGLLLAVVITSLVAWLRPPQDSNPGKRGPYGDAPPRGHAALVGLAVLVLMFCYVVGAYVIGMLPALVFFIPAVFITLARRASLGMVFLTIALFAFVFVVFDRFLAVPWEHPLFPQVERLMFGLLR